MWLIHLGLKIVSCPPDVTYMQTNCSRPCYVRHTQDVCGVCTAVEMATPAWSQGSSGVGLCFSRWPTQTESKSSQRSVSVLISKSVLITLVLIITLIAGCVTRHIYNPINGWVSTLKLDGPYDLSAHVLIQGYMDSLELGYYFLYRPISTLDFLLSQWLCMTQGKTLTYYILVFFCHLCCV